MQTSSGDKGLVEQAAKLRKRAKQLPDGIEREDVLHEARVVESALRMNGWLTSRELKTG